MPKPSAFTLIELLVVITIIVVLLTLLTPALDRAIYQAEIAVCGANQKTLATGITSYAMSNKRQYPWRPSVDAGAEPHILRPVATLDDFDDRTFLFDYVTLDILIDPLVEPVDISFEGTDFDTVVITVRNLWYYWRFDDHAQMKKLGDRWSWSYADEEGRPVRERFDYIASDRDNPNNFGNELVFSSHPDEDGVMTNLVLRNETFDEAGEGGTGVMAAIGPAVKVVDSEWWAPTTRKRGVIDMNFASADNSVARVNDVLWTDDERMTRVPMNQDGGDWPDNWVHLKKP